MCICVCVCECIIYLYLYIYLFIWIYAMFVCILQVSLVIFLSAVHAPECTAIQFRRIEQCKISKTKINDKKNNKKKTFIKILPSATKPCTMDSKLFFRINSLFFFFFLRSCTSTIERTIKWTYRILNGKYCPSVVCSEEKKKKKQFFFFLVKNYLRFIQSDGIMYTESFRFIKERLNYIHTYM